MQITPKESHIFLENQLLSDYYHFAIYSGLIEAWNYHIKYNIGSDVLNVIKSDSQSTANFISKYLQFLASLNGP